MQLAQVKHNNVTTNAARQQSFSVAQTAEMFSLLSANVYTDPVKAVIREIICNAMDAHTKAGKADEPVEVHLPTQYEPWFAVKDNGPGMSDDDVYNIFCVYGASTKTNNNDETGGFGIGAKAPFAVTDQFTVNVRHNGKYTIYSAYKNDNGVPQMSILSVSDTEECNGVEVHVPIGDRSDNTFKYKYVECSRAFKVQPKINTPMNIGYNYCEFDLGDGVIGKVDLNASRYTTNTYTVHMGNVEYRGSLDNTGGINVSFIFEVPVGTFMPSANRESLQSKDLSLILTYAKKLEKQIALHLEEQIKHASSIVEATKFIVNNDADAFLFHARGDDTTVKFRGTDIRDLDYLIFTPKDLTKNMGDELRKKYEQSSLSKNTDSMLEFKFCAGAKRFDWSFVKPKEMFQHGQSVSIRADRLFKLQQNLYFIMYSYHKKHILIKNHDMSMQNRRGLYQKIRYYLTTEYPGADLARTFEVHYKDGSADLEHNKNFYDYVLPSIVDIFDKVVDFKDLPEVPKEVKTREARPARTLKPFGLRLKYSNTQYGVNEVSSDINVTHTEVKVDLEEGGYYLPITRRQISDTDMRKISLALSLKESNHRCGKNLVDKNRKLVAVPKTILKEFEKHPKWFNYADKCEQEYARALGKTGLHQSLLDTLKHRLYLYNRVIDDCLDGGPLGFHKLETLIDKGNDYIFDLVPMASAILKEAGVIDDFEKVLSRCTKISKKLGEILSTEALRLTKAWRPTDLTTDAVESFCKNVGFKCERQNRYEAINKTHKANKEFCRSKPGLMDVINNINSYDEKSVIAYAKALDIPLKKGYNTNSTNGKD